MPRKATTPGEKVGYAKPPRNTRFKPGQSGNPKGRPKGSVSLEDTFWKSLGKKVQITEKGKQRSVPALEAIILRLREKALKGDAKALDQILRYAALMNPEHNASQVTQQPTQEDIDLVHAYLEQSGKVDCEGGEDP